MYDACCTSPELVTNALMRDMIVHAAKSGKLDIHDLHDPGKRNVVVGQIAELMRTANIPLDSSALAEVSKGVVQSAEDGERTIASYRERWERTDVAKNGFNVRQRTGLLSEYMNIVKVMKHEPRVTMGHLYALEEACRRKETEDDGSTMLSILTTDEQPSTKISSPDERMRRRVSMNKAIKADIRITDVYFQLGITAWNDLLKFGLTKDMLSERTGAVPLVPLMDLYQVTFGKIMTDLRIIAKDLAEAKITARDMYLAKITYPHLHMKMGLTKEVMAEFGFTPSQWNTELRMDKKFLFAPLQFGVSDFQTFDWTPDDLQTGFGLSQLEMRHVLGIPNVEPPAPVRNVVVPVQTLHGPVFDTVPL